MKNALRIIVDKNVNVRLVLRTTDVNEYNKILSKIYDQTTWADMLLTTQEYNTVKDVISNV